MAQPDLIVWDFDGVLNANVVDGRFVWADTLQADLGIDPQQLSAHLFASGLMRRVISGQVDLRDVVGDWLTDIGQPVTADEMLAYWFDKDALPDAEVLGLLRAHPARHVIGTNNEARRAAYIETVMGFGDQVDHVFASGRMGCAKPDAVYFKQIEDWAGLSGAQILLVDDTLPNIEACTARGWQGFHFTDATRTDLPSVLGLDQT